MDMRVLLDENFWFDLFVEEAWDWQATMMQPVGGMDRIPYAFAKALGPVVQYSSPVTEIRKTANGSSRVVYAGRRDEAGGGGVLHYRDAVFDAEEDSE